MQGIILCGGKAERLGDICKTTPKSMLMFKGKPLLWYQLMWLKKYYVTDIILCVGHLHQSIRNYFGNGKDLGIKIRYSIENEPLGTGGAIYNAFKFCRKDRPVIVLNGDVYGEFNIFDMIYKWSKTKNPMIAAKKLINCQDYGTLQGYNDIITNFREKENVTNKFINSGVYILIPETIPNLKTKSFSIEKDIFPTLAEKELLHIYKAKYDNNFWIDIGVPERLANLHVHMGDK